MDKCSDLKYLTPEQLNYSAATFATAISQKFDIDSTGVLGSFFTALGNMLTLAAKQRALKKTAAQVNHQLNRDFIQGNY